MSNIINVPSHLVQIRCHIRPRICPWSCLHARYQSSRNNWNGAHLDCIADSVSYLNLANRTRQTVIYSWVLLLVLRLAVTIYRLEVTSKCLSWTLSTSMNWGFLLPSYALITSTSHSKLYDFHSAYLVLNSPQLLLALLHPQLATPIVIKMYVYSSSCEYHN